MGGTAQAEDPRWFLRRYGCARRDRSKDIQLLVLPGLLTQRLTTAEPDRGMVGVAVASLRSVLRREQPEQVPETEAVAVPV